MSTSSGDESRRHEPRTAGVSNTLVPVPISAMPTESSRGLAVTISPVAALDDASYLLLHEIRLRGVVEITDESSVASLVEFGFVARASRGVRITPEGRAANTAWARLEPGTDAEQVVQRGYTRFLPLNQELLRLCHDWQSQPGDWSVLDRATTLDERIAPIVNHVSTASPRFASYRRLLGDALARVHDGQNDWLTSPRFDSYHTVWMRLHEDLLLALGADRASEPAS